MPVTTRSRHLALSSATSAGRKPPTLPARGSEFVLDFFLSSHLGDALCSTPLAKQLTQERGLRVLSVKHRSTLAVFANNPWVAGFTSRRGSRLFDLMQGSGHMIQRLQRGLGLTVDAMPRPEVHLSQDELAWARNERAKWPKDRPVCLFSSRIVTNARFYGQVDWTAVAEAWQKTCTIVQPIITSPPVYKEQVGILRRPEEWSQEESIPGESVVVYRDLPLRHYMALFSVSDYFCGGLSGGAHLAAAFRMPALIVLWREMLQHLRFPSNAQKLAADNWAYEDQQYLDAEHVSRGRVQLDRLYAAIQGTHATQRQHAHAVTGSAEPLAVLHGLD